MKKIIIIIASAIPVVIFIIFIFLFIKSKINYHYKEEPFDEYLSYYNQKIKYNILKKLGYKTEKRTLKYKKEIYDIIVLDYNFEIFETDLNKHNKFNNKEKNVFYEKWDKWLKQGKRLIVFFHPYQEVIGLNSYFNNFDYYWRYNTEYSKVNIKKRDNKFLNRVNSLYIDTNNYMTKRDLSKINTKIKPILKQGNKIFIAYEDRNKSQIIYISDYFIFSDKSILQMDNAIFLNNLLRDYFNKVIIFDKVLNHNGNNTYKNNSSIPFFLTGAFKFISMQLLILAFIFFLIVIKRFGKPVNMLEFKNRLLKPHLNAVGYFFEKTNNETILNNILNEYFVFQLKQTLKFFSSNSDLFEEINKRYNLSKEEQNLFDFEKKRTKKEIISLHIKRHKFVKKIREG